MGRHEALTAGQVPVCRSVPAFGASAPEQVYTFATAAVKDSAGAAIKDGSTKRRESRASLGRHSVGRGTQAPRKPGKPKESGFLWAGVAEEFYLQIKGWPVDVDLTDKLKDGRVAGMPIDAKLVQAVLHLLANGGKSSYFNHAQSAKKGEGAGLIAPSLFAAKARVSVLLECNPEDAKRALNLFKWWQGRHPKTPQLLLLRPLIRALERGSLHTDVEAVWKIYKVPAIQDDYFVVDMCTAFFYLEMYDAVLAVYQEAIHTRSVIAGRVNDVVVQAICAKHASAEEIWAYYKELVNRTGWVITVPGYVALLEAGVTVEQIRSLKYKQPDRMLHRLICALTFLSQNHEVGVIANELIQDNQPMRDSDALVLTLTALVYAGFETGAQRLAELQTEKHGVRLDKALESKISDRHSFALAGINSYELMSTLEGPHQTSLPVQAALILHCYFPLKDTDKMWQVSRNLDWATLPSI